MVRVEPVTQIWAEALALGDDVFAERFGIAVEPGWEGFQEVMAFLAEVRHASAPDEWGLHLVFDEDGALVGNAGWKGEPVDGAAELGYAVAPSRRGCGIATAVVHELLVRARTARLRTVVAHTLAEPSPSTSVLARCRFANVAEVLDPNDGPIRGSSPPAARSGRRKRERRRPSSD